MVDSLRTLKVHHCLSLVTIGCPIGYTEGVHGGGMWRDTVEGVCRGGMWRGYAEGVHGVGTQRAYAEGCHSN